MLSFTETGDTIYKGQSRMLAVVKLKGTSSFFVDIEVGVSIAAKEKTGSGFREQSVLVMQITV